MDAPHVSVTGEWLCSARSELMDRKDVLVNKGCIEAVSGMIYPFVPKGQY